MSAFSYGFSDELTKIARSKIDKETLAWALSSGLTGGLISSLMGGMLAASANAGRRKKDRKSIAKSMLGYGAFGAASGLGRGFLHRGAYNKILSKLNKPKKR